MSRARLFIAAVLAAVGCPVLPAGCQDFPPLEPCGEIPPGGCPVGRGGSCSDPTCTGVYDCVSGVWTSVQVCSASDGGASGAGGGGSGGGATGGGLRDGGPCTPVNIDLTGQVTDCTPDLESPDCPVQAALGCAETVCLTGCADFFLCLPPGWTDVAHCADDGGLVVTQPHAQDAGP